MTHRTLDSDGFARSTVSNGTRRQPINSQRDMLWNVIEPGDPYDIRKSMIANLPNQSKKFMGDNIELVCLFQVAEIQRLNQYLLEYRERYLELERRELDRHSYQVQIKELTERLASEHNLRNENYKLQQHIRRLNIEIEQLHQKLRASSGSAVDAANYQSALQKIQALIQQNSSLNYRNTSLQAEISRLRNEFSALERSRSQQRDDYNYRLDQANRLAASASEANSIKSKYQNDLYRAQKEIQRLNQSLQMKNHEISDLFERLSYMEGQMNSQRNNAGKMTDYENKIALMAQQIERLQSIVNDRSRKYDDLLLQQNRWDATFKKIENQKRIADDTLNRVSSDNQRLKYIVSGYQQERNKTMASQNILPDMERQLVIAGQQIERLNKIIKMLNTEKDSLRINNEQLVYQANLLPNLQRQNKQLKDRLSRQSVDQGRIYEYEQKVALLTSQINRLHQIVDNLQNLQQQNDRLREQNARFRLDINKIEDSLKNKHYSQMQNLRRDYEERIRNIQINISNRYITEINENKSKYEIMISNLSQNIDPDADKKVQILSDQVDRLNRILEDLRRDNNQLYAKNGELERLLPQLEEKDQIIRNLEARIQDLDSRIRGLLGQKIDVETRIRSISQENQNYRKNQDFTMRDIEGYKNENLNLRKQVQGSINLQLRVSDLEKQLKQLRQQNDRLRQHFSQIDVLHKQIDSLKQQNYRLRMENDDTRTKLTQENDGRIRQVQGDITNKYVTQITNIRNYYDQKINSLQNDVDPDANKKIGYLIQELDRLNDEVIPNLQRQNSDLVSQNIKLRQNAKDSEELRILVDSLRNRIQDLQNQLRSLQGENIQVHTRIRSVSQQHENVKRNHDFAARELDNLRRQNNDLKQRLSELIGQQGKSQEYKNQITYLQNQLNQLNIIINELGPLKNENDRLNGELQSLRGQTHLIGTLNEKIRYLQSQLMKLQEQNKQVMIQLRSSKDQQSLISSLTSRLRQLESQLYQLRAENNRLNQQSKSSRDKDSLIQHLQMRIKQLEQKLRNIEGQNYETKGRVRSLSQQHDNLKRDHDNANRGIQGLRRENDELRKKITQLMVKLQKNTKQLDDLDRLRNQLNYISQRYNDVVDENVKLSQKLRDLVNIEQQFKSLKQINETYSIQITELKATITTLQTQRDKINGQLYSSKANQRRQQQVLEKLTQQLERLNELLSKKYSDLTSTQNKLVEITAKYEEIKISYTKIETTYKIIKQENSSLHETISKLQKSLNDAEQKIRLLNGDLDRLESSVGQKDSIIKSKQVRIQEKQTIIDSLRRQISDALSLNSNYQQKIRQLEAKLKSSQINAQTYSNQVQTKNRQIQDLEQQIRRLREELGQYVPLKGEKDRLEAQIRMKDDDFNRERAGWSKKVDDYEKDKKLQDKKKKKNDINSQFNYNILLFLQDQTQRLKKQKDNLYNKDISELRSQIEMLLADNAALKKYTSDLNVQIEQKQKYFYEQIAKLNREKDELQAQLDRIKAENNQKIDKKKLKDFIKSINQDTQNRNTFYEDEIKRARGQKQNISNKYQIQIRKLMDQLNSQKSKIISETQKIKQYEILIQRLNKNLQQLYTELSQRDSNRKNLQNQLQDYKYKIQMMQKEDDMKSNRIRNLEQQIDNINQNNKTLSHKITQLEIISHKISIYETRISQLTKTVQILTEKNSNLQVQGQHKGQKYKDLVAELRDYENTLERLISQYRTLEQVLQQYKQQNNGLLATKQDYEKVKGDLSYIQNEKNSLNNNINILNETLIKIRSEKDNIIRDNMNQQARISQKFREQYSRRIDQYERIISDLTQTNSSLKTQVSDYDRAKMQISDLTKKIQRLIKDLERANNDLQDSIDRQHKLQNSNNQLKRTIQEYLRRITELEKQKNTLEQLIDTRGQQAEACIEKFTGQNKQLRAKLEKVRQSANKIPQYQAKIKELNRMVDELTDKIHHDFKTQTSFGQKLTSAQIQRNDLLRTIQQLKGKLYASQNTYKTSLENLSYENNDLRKKSSSIPELSIKTQSLQEKNYQLISKVQALQRYNAQKDREKQQIRQQYENRLKYSSNDNAKQIDQYRKLQIQFNTLLKEYETLKQKANQSDIGISKINEQFQRLQTIIEKLRKERSSIIEKNVNLGREFDKLAAINRSFENDIKELRLQLSDKMTVQKRLQQQLALMVVLFAQIESLRGRLQSSEIQIQNLRRDSSAPYRF